MASFINKRQQARNERNLQDLIRNVSGNDRCADCQSKNPGWASWSLGIFLCMRCATLHRKLGTHISKVKSLSMDTWSSEQVENMKKVGNTISNRTYNPRNVRPTLPLDPDEIDIAMEKFIREKYQRRTLGMDANSSSSPSRNNTGSSGSVEDRPPPVPAKNTPRFAPALRSASANYPPSNVDRPLPPVRDTDRFDLGGDEEKLARLRDMGFLDDKKNIALLKGLKGDVDRTVEALVRLGDGNDSVRINASARSNLPLLPRTDSRGAPVDVNGPLPLPKRRSAAQLVEISQPASSAAPTNSQPPPQQPRNNSYNPFETQTAQQPLAQQSATIETSLQNLHISHPPPLQSNTGPWQAPTQYNPFLNYSSPPVSPSPYPNNAVSTYSLFGPDQMPQHSHVNPATTTNPFLKTSRSQTFHPSNPYGQSPHASSYWPDPATAQLEIAPMPPVPPWVQTHRSASQPQLFPQQAGSPIGPTTNPFGTSSLSSSPMQPTFSQSVFSQPAFPQQSTFTESPYQSPRVQTPLSTVGQQATGEYPFYSMPAHAQPQPQTQVQMQTQPQVQAPPQQQQQFLPNTVQAAATTQRFDKSSIMALFNQPYTQPASAIAPPQQQEQQPEPNATNPAGWPTTYSQAQSTLTPIAEKGRNPFAHLLGGGNHAREESKDFSSLALSSNANGGRHSPDAFKGLSSRYQ